DYIVKPVRDGDLTRALDKLERILAMPVPSVHEEATGLLARIERALRARPEIEQRVVVRSNDRFLLLELSRVSHFRADSKLTYAVTDRGSFEVEASLNELEARLAAAFFRIHRAVLVNLEHVEEIDVRSAAGASARLRGPARIELPIARSRVRTLKERIGG